LTSAVDSAIARFNAGDASGFSAHFAPGAIIIDEHAPFAWSGKGAAERWIRDVDAYNSLGRIVNFHLTPEEPVAIYTDKPSGKGYVLALIKESYDVPGRHVSRYVDLTASLVHSGGTWQITNANWAEDVGLLKTR